MTILEYYIEQQSNNIWYEKFYSSSNKQSGKTFSYINTNFRSLSSFLIQLDRFRSKVGIERKNWNDKLPSGQELDKHRISNLVQAGFIREEESFYFYTPKGVAALDLIDEKYDDNEKWILLYLLILDYHSIYIQFDVLLTTRDIFDKLKKIGYSNEHILNELHKIINLSEKTMLFNENIFWLITFVNDEQFINLFAKSSESEKDKLKEYVIRCSKQDKSKDLIAHKFEKSGVYNVLTFRDDVRVLYYTFHILRIFKDPFDSFIDRVIELYCEDRYTSNGDKNIKDFINRHKSIYIKVKQKLIQGVN